MLSTVSVEGIVATGMRCVCRMIFSHGFVHADIHPGNVLFQAPQRIVLCDLGLVGRLTDADRLTTAKTLLAFATGDGKTVARLFYDNAPFRATPDYDTYEAEMAALVESLLSRGLGNLEISLEVGRSFDVLRRHRIQARSHMTMVNVALVAAEGLGKAARAGALSDAGGAALSDRGGSRDDGGGLSGTGPVQVQLSRVQVQVRPPGCRFRDGEPAGRDRVRANAEVCDTWTWT